MNLDKVSMEFDPEDIEMTTLAVPKVFRQHLKDEYDGHNDFERLQNWASEFSEEQAENAVAEYFHSEVFREKVIGIITNELTTYNHPLREELEEVIEEKFRDIQGNRY